MKIGCRISHPAKVSELVFSNKKIKKYYQVYMLIAAWILIWLSSIFNASILFLPVFIVISLILNIFTPYGGIALLIIILHSPGAALSIPGGVFTWAFIAIVPKIIYYIFKYNLIKKSFSGPIILILLFSLYAFLTIFWLDNSSYFLNYAAYYLQAALLCIAAAVVLRQTGAAGALIEVWVLAAGAAIIIKVSHFLLGPDTALYELIANGASSGDLDLSERVSVFSGGEITTRLIWPGDEPNYASALLTVGLAMSLALARAQPDRYKVWLACSASIIVQIAGTYSRSGMIAAAAILVYHSVRSGKAFLGISAAITLPVVITYFFYLPFQDRLKSIFSDSTGSAEIRYELWARGIEDWGRSPFFGNGLSSFFADVGWAAHNTYIQLLSELGILGFLLWISIPLFAVRKAFNAASASRNRTEKRLHIDLALGLVSTLLMAATITLHDIKFLWFAIIIVSAHADKRRLLYPGWGKLYATSA